MEDKPSSQIKARAKELLQGEEAKYGFSQEQWIILKAVFEDKEHKEESTKKMCFKCGCSPPLEHCIADGTVETVLDNNQENKV